MTGMSGYDEERLADLLRALPPAPRAWVVAAQQLPFARVDEVLERAEADRAFRRALGEDVVQALERAGFEADPLFVEALRERLER